MKLPTAGLLIICDRKLLLAFSKNKQCFYLPGGKINPIESAEEALCREIEEELNVHICDDELKYYTHISAPAFGEPEGIIMEQECFFVNKDVQPKPAAEIGEVKYFSLSEYLEQMHTAPGAIMILEKLKADGYVD
jgi:ADP-ribose pyrophosphatase YjhB (NUDIX family)